MRVAIIGAGISGIVAARELCAEHEVAVFEAASRVGGDARTSEIQIGNQVVPVDTGFLIFNECRYPRFGSLLRELGVATRDADVSLTIQSDKPNLLFRGTTLRDLLRSGRNFTSPAFYATFRDLLRFARHAKHFSAVENVEFSLEDFISLKRYSPAFVDLYLVPMLAGVSQMTREEILQLPLPYAFAFLNTHGLLQLTEPTGWKTVIGGARAYMSKLTAPIEGFVHRNHCVVAISRAPDHVLIKFQDRPSQRFDAVVLGTHADQALSLLADPTRPERRILGAFQYRARVGVLHTDRALLPTDASLWGSWNYRLTDAGTRTVAFTYNLSRLNGLTLPEPLLLTFNSPSVSPEHLLQTFDYQRVVLDRRSYLAQRSRSQINGVRRTYFCGAYWGNGFHEDAVASAHAVVDLVRQDNALRIAETCGK